MNNVNYSIFPNSIMFPPAIQNKFIKGISEALKDNNLDDLDDYNEEDIKLTKILENSAGCCNLYFENREIKDALIVYNKFIEQYKKNCPTKDLVGCEGILLKKDGKMYAILIKK